MNDARAADENARAARMAGIEAFHVMEVLARAKALEAQGRDIVHMEVGEPDFPTPQPVVDAAHRALDAGHTRYTPAAGIPELRRAIAEFYAARYGVAVAPERILVTPGASGALQLALGVLVGPGDGVLLADPGYPCNRHFVRVYEGVPWDVPVGPETSYQLCAEHVRSCTAPQLKAVLVASPSNPTGTVVAPRELARIVEETERRGAWPVVDEIYHGLVYDARAETALRYSDRAFVVNSFSKYFGMTGWRLGWLVAPEALARDAEKLAQNLYISAPTLAQHAALEAFEPGTLEILEDRRQQFRERRDFLLPALRALGFAVPVEPQGAFYLYADCSRFSADSFGFAVDVLERAGVAITPGLDFGRNAPERHVRFAYTTSIERLREGVARLRAYLRG